MRNKLFIHLLLVFALFGGLSPVCAEKIEGRFVYVLIPGEATLSLAEVQVFSGGINIALNQTTTQTSTHGDRVSSLAVDGNTSGNWEDGSITHTQHNALNPAWVVDLGDDYDIEKISVWNRDGHEARLNNAHVIILDEKRKVLWSARSDLYGPGETSFVVAIDNDHALPTKKIDKVYGDKKSQRTPQLKKQVFKVEMVGGLRLAINDLMSSFGRKYPNGKEYLKRLDEIESNFSADAFETLQREALLANPLLDFDKLLFVRRVGYYDGMPQNWVSNSSLPKNSYDNQIAILDGLDAGEIKTVHQPLHGKFVGDVDLHYDAKKMLFSSIGTNGAWAVFEVGVNGEGLRQVSPDMGNDVDSYDPLYLPDGRIIFCCSSGYAGVPCVGGSQDVANLHIMNADGTGVRRLCFDQENEWHPVMLNDGRVMYLRWEYTDSAHYFSRILMHMNPDGTDQKSYYGSNSYWPNSLFFARPIPGSSSKFVGIVSGHHGERRAGPMVLFDVSKGRHEADGAVQLIPGYGKPVKPLVYDQLAHNYEDHALHPFPLSDKYFLCSKDDMIMLVDVFDNAIILKQEPGVKLLEPLPLRKTMKPPVLPDRVNLEDKEATVFINDIYEGPGLMGVPKGEVKSIRVFKYEYSPRHHGGHYAMGMEAGWDVKSVLGVVPVEDDGSAMFKIPANTPISLQPLDEEGKALQLMRSWLVGMPGENLSCVGCHESQNMTPPQRRSSAMSKKPERLKGWYGPVRGMSFSRDVMPVIDKYCAGCHDGSNDLVKLKAKGIKVTDRITGTGDNTGKRFSEVGIPSFAKTSDAYLNIHPYVRRNGPEGDYHLLTPLEFHADTSELIQMLKKGHHNVKLDQEAWDRLYTWIDLNAPYRGTWAEAGAQQGALERRLELRAKYANVNTDAETIVNAYTNKLDFIAPAPLEPKPETKSLPPEVKGYKAETSELDLGDGIKMKLVGIPAGKFSMGSNAETPDEQPVARIKIAKPFWMGATEISLKQYRQFDPDYDNGVYDMHYKDQINRGYYMNKLDFPVIRVPWQKAVEYCKWLSKKTGKKVTLPTESQWEWACRAGTNAPFSYGNLDTDFSVHANLADLKTKEMAVKGVNPRPIYNPTPYYDYELKDPRFNDNTLHLAKVGSFKANAWGLYDMHGNVAEWTLSEYKPYPYKDDGRNKISEGKKRVVRGGSWHDRPFRSTSSFRLGYPDWQKVYNTGFRVVVED